jgi:hypothetical protein
LKAVETVEVGARREGVRDPVHALGLTFGDVGFESELAAAATSPVAFNDNILFILVSDGKFLRVIQG